MSGKDRDSVLNSCREELEKLHPLEDKEEVWRAFRSARRKKLLLIALLAGAVLTAVGALTAVKGRQLAEDGSLLRKSYGQGAAEVRLVADIGEERIPVTVEVEERLYTEQEIKELEKQAFTVLQQIVLGENGSAAYVEQDLTLPENVAGYPFRITWESSDELAVSYTGKVGNGRELSESGELVTLQAVFTYHDWSCSEAFPIRVYPPRPGSAESRKQKLMQSVEEADDRTAVEERLVLPKELEGKQVAWKESGNRLNWLLPALWAAVCLAVWLREGEKIQQAAACRKQQLADSYAEFVSKLLLMMEAGMSLRNAILRIGSIYADQRKNGGKKNEAYEELTAVCRELEKGVPEREAYRHLGIRAGLPAYRKLAALLNQSNRLGAAGFREQLQEEAETAWEERKAKAKQKGEEAGTKLLLPMMVMLLLVLVFIMLPAYLSFSAV